MYIFSKYNSLSSRLNSFNKILLSTLVFFFISQQSVLSATVTWTGNTSSDWTVASNWSGGLPAGNDVVIPTSPSGGNWPVFSTGSSTINKLTIQTGATLTQSGGTLLANKATSISGTFNQTAGTFLSNDNVTVNSGGQINQSSSGIIHLASSLSSEPNKKLTIDGGIVNAVGIVRIRDLELKNGGTLNQANGEIVVYHDFRCTTGNTFNSTGGTIRFAGSAGPGADFQGNVQFHNVVIDSGVDPNFDNDNGPNINVSGNFTNNNTGLDLTKTSFTFNGTGDQTIYSAASPVPARTTFGSVTINKTSGTVKLLSDVAVENNYYTTSGSIDTNGHTLWVGGVALPVELSSFSAVMLESGIKLVWTTETEVNNYGFEIFRSAQNNQWQNIGFVQGNGNSNSPKNYSFLDENVTVGNYSYRLKQIDTDGQFEYSKVIEISLDSPSKFELSQNYPNPFNPATTISFILPESGNIKLTVYNIIGEQVAELVNGYKEAGVYSINFDASEMNSGLYIYKLQTNNFSQSRKMTLIK